MKVFNLIRGSFVLLEHFTLNSGRRCSHAAIFSKDRLSSHHVENIEKLAEYSGLPEDQFLRNLPQTSEEYAKRKALVPDQPENPHLLKVALVGEPNVGKSTLINALVKRKIFPVSKKVHTTRRKGSAVIIEENKQVVFLDTPGFVTPEHSKRHKLEISLVVDPKNSATAADLIGVVIDASNKFTKKTINPGILQLLDNLRDKTSILILNKVDAVKSKGELLKICRILTEQKKRDPQDGDKDLANDELILGREAPRIEQPSIPKFFPDSEMKKRQGWPYFSQVFMISALKNDGVDKLREFMFSVAKPAPWIYHSSNITDQHPHIIVRQIIQEKLLNALPREIPYGLKVHITSWILDSTGVLRITAAIKCPNSRHKSLVIGRSGSLISECVHSARQDITDVFHSEVMLKIEVK